MLRNSWTDEIRDLHVAGACMAIRHPTSRISTAYGRTLLHRTDDLPGMAMCKFDAGLSSPLNLRGSTGNAPSAILNLVMGRMGVM